MKQFLIFLSILLLAALFRFTGLNWDTNQHLHPDERFLTMVATGINWPEGITQYFDTNTSPLNPHNRGFDFFVYGTFPIFLVKLIAETLSLGSYNDLTLVGRALSALTDLGTVILVFLLAKQLLRNYKPSTANHSLTNLLFFSMFAYALMTLPIQLSHFYTTDPYLTFFLTLTLLLVVAVPHQLAGEKQSRSFVQSSLSGLSFGLALASKISAVYFLPVIAIFYLYRLLKDKRIVSIFTEGILFLLTTGLTLKVTQPYLFDGLFTLQLNPKVLANWQQLSSFNDIGFPPAIQWINTTPYLHPLLQGFFWGVGPTLGIITIIGISAYISSMLRAGGPRIIIFLWLLIPILLQGGQFVKAMRYFSPFYPILAIFAGLGLTNIISYLQKLNQFARLSGFVIIVGLIFTWPVAFLSIHLQPHTRVTASEWIYQNIPTGSTLSSDHWDDGLPLCLSPDKCRQYAHEELHLFDPDSPEKWATINEQLQKIDYLVITSNRVYGALGSVPEKFPLTNNFYRQLFSGQLNFTKVAEFTSRPSLPFPVNIQIDYPFFNYGRIPDKYHDLTMQQSNNAISFVDDFAEETWTVYDHPKVIIFRKNN